MMRGRVWQRGMHTYMTSTRMTPEAPPPLDPPPLDARRRRILFRATHRGTHENDILIGGYLAPRLATMAESELDAVEALLRANATGVYLRFGDGEVPRRADASQPHASRHDDIMTS